MLSRCSTGKWSLLHASLLCRALTSRSHPVLYLVRDGYLNRRGTRVLQPMPGLQHLGPNGEEKLAKHTSFSSFHSVLLVCHWVSQPTSFRFSNFCGVTRLLLHHIIDTIPISGSFSYQFRDMFTTYFPGIYASLDQTGCSTSVRPMRLVMLPSAVFEGS